jgi:hypothetical protein
MRLRAAIVEPLRADAGVWAAPQLFAWAADSWGSMQTDVMRIYDLAPMERISIDENGLRRAARGLIELLDTLWPELIERARTPRARRTQWPALDSRTVEEQYLVGLALDCARFARGAVVRAIMQDFAEGLAARPAPAAPRHFHPDADLRLVLVAAAAAREAEAHAEVN